ncbi:BBSome-interacting protein 1 [Cephus cinctus]|uniref:BBSome-interacting protein 1 n=1 Tax=Cephus cinctus TaxID=211228 RepID=A0AAJ7FP41_CEPCN|nr:BBSome-interacting protein 1 [Cephus cinctus]
MSETTEKTSERINIVIPQQGFLYSENKPHYILCKPKLMPLKSVTLEKLEKMQKDAEMKMKEMQKDD